MLCSCYDNDALTPTYITLHTRDHKKTEKRRTENLFDVTPVPVRTSECSLLSNIIYGFGEINIKNRKGKTTARTIKKLVVKVRGERGAGRAAQSTARPASSRAATLPRPPSARPSYPAQ